MLSCFLFVDSTERWRNRNRKTAVTVHAETVASATSSGTSFEAAVSLFIHVLVESDTVWVADESLVELQCKTSTSIGDGMLSLEVYS